MWFVGEDADDVIDEALPILESEGLDYDKLTPEAVANNYPLINTADLRYIVHEKKTGYLLARAGCQAVKDLFVREGGDFILAKATPKSIINQGLNGVKLSTGEVLEADQYIFSCGPWLEIFSLK